MEVTLAVIQGLLLAVVSVNSLENCEVEKTEAYYYVYKTSVTHKAYYCSYSDEEDSKCVRFNGKLLDAVNDVTHDCTYGFLEVIGKFFRGQRTWIKFCELPILINLTATTVTFADNTMCLYNRRSCYNMNVAKEVFWAKGNYCRQLLLLHSGTFAAWRYPQNQVTFIQDQTRTLILTKTFKYCGTEMWKTKFNDIIVLENRTRTGNSTSVVGKMPCRNITNIDETTEESVTNATTWYIYKYPSDVKVYVCLKNATCEDMKMNETLPKQSVELTNQCVNDLYTSEATICEKILRLHLEEDMLEGLPPECGYSKGLCKRFIKAFWTYTDRCALIEKVYEGYVRECENGVKCVVANDSTELMLFREGKLCGEDVWYTPEIGLVASERELLFSTSKTDEDGYVEVADKFEFRQDEDIETLQLLLYCVVFCVAFSVLWCVFNVLVNFISLRKLNKDRNSKDRVGLMNCFSQSLTARHLLLTDHEGEEKLDESKLESFELYVSVDNDLYNTS